MQTENQMIPEIKLLSGQSILIDYGNEIDLDISQKVSHVAHVVGQSKYPWITDMVPAYSSLSIFFNPIQVMNLCGDDQPLEWVKKQIEGLTKDAVIGKSSSVVQGPLHNIPVYYDGEDLKEISTLKNLEVQAIVEIHTSRIYTVFMIGFLPGFAYLGAVDERIAVARRTKPRAQVAAGSVGIAGLQTGVYPLDSPGGWQIIGRTPLAMFRPDSSFPSRLKHGDRVKFYSISLNQFEALREH